MAVAWPYAQGSLHLGHMAGAYLPADIFARYHRSVGDRVLMVSGSDTHGTPITVRAEQEGVTPQEIVDRYHPEFLRYWEELGIRWELFTRTDTANHIAVGQDFFLRLLDRGYLYRKETQQYFDPEVGRFLPDRYVEGTCPYCGYEHARGDQCDNCGRTLDPEELLEPRSKQSGAVPVMRTTEHYYWRLGAFTEPLLEWLESRVGWRPHVLNSAIGMVREGLHDRAFTRDLDWGIPLPVDDLGPGKVIYVWWEAVMGYLSAAKEWAQRRGEPDAWKEWWENPDAVHYYFVGKDNIPFHAVYWPALLMGYGGLVLPTDVPANQYVTFRGEKASKSRGVGRPVLWYLERFQPDALRYALAVHLPETSDTDLGEDEMVRAVNDELVATWGNLVHRVVSMVHRYCDGVVPEATTVEDADEDVRARARAALEETAANIERVRLRAGLAAAMRGAQEVNTYLNLREPWRTAADDPARTATTLATALDAIGTVAVALSPYLPFTSPAVLEALGVAVPEAGPRWEPVTVVAGTRLPPPAPLFVKMEPLDESAG